MDEKRKEIKAAVLAGKMVRKAAALKWDEEISARLKLLKGNKTQSAAMPDAIAVLQQPIVRSEGLCAKAGQAERL